MRILLIHQYFLERQGAGISRFNQFAKYWTAHGHTVTVICGMVHYMTGEKPARYHRKVILKERVEDIEIVRVFVSDAYNKNFIGRMWGYLSFMMSACVAVCTLSKHDVVIATSPPLHVGIPGLLASWLWRKPLVFEVRDLWPESAIEMGVLSNSFLIRIAYWLEALMYKTARRIVVLTPAFSDALISKKDVAAEKIVFIPNGADLDLLIPTESRDHVRQTHTLSDRFTVLYIGAHGIANHLNQILDAAALLKENSAILFLLIGTGMEKKRLVERAKRECLPNVRFLDPIPKERIANIISACDAGLAVLKKADIFKTVYPNKIFDYMACKKPIICAIDGVARKLVEAAEAGVFVEPETPRALADAILDLLQKPEQCRQYGDSGYAYVREHFSRKVLAGKYEETLRAIEGRSCDL